MNCRDCPYIDEYDKENRPINECWCDKIGGKIWRYGVCSDAHSPTIMSNKLNKKDNNVNFIKHNSKMSKKHERDWKYRKHTKKLAKINEYNWFPSYYLVTKKWIHNCGWVELSKPYYQRFYRSQYSKYIKKQCNKQVRRYKGEISNGGSYKKVAEFWWELY